MNPAPNPDYSRLISELIKKQIVILGPDITFAKVRNIVGLHVDVNGDIQGIERDPKTVFDELSNEFIQLSSLIVKKTMESILQSDKVQDNKDTTPESHNPQNTDTDLSSEKFQNNTQTDQDTTNPPQDLSYFALDKKDNPLEDVEMPNENFITSNKNDPQSFTDNELSNLNKSLKDQVLENISPKTNPS